MTVQELIDELQKIENKKAEVYVVLKTKDVTGYSSWTWWHTTVGESECGVDEVYDLETKVHLTGEGMTEYIHEDWDDLVDKDEEDKI